MTVTDWGAPFWISNKIYHFSCIPVQGTDSRILKISSSDKIRLSTDSVDNHIMWQIADGYSEIRCVLDTQRPLFCLRPIPAARLWRPRRTTKIGVAAWFETPLTSTNLSWKQNAGHTFDCWKCDCWNLKLFSPVSVWFRRPKTHENMPETTYTHTHTHWNIIFTFSIRIVAICY